MLAVHTHSRIENDFARVGGPSRNWNGVCSLLRRKPFRAARIRKFRNPVGIVKTPSLTILRNEARKRSSPAAASALGCSGPVGMIGNPLVDHPLGRPNDEAAAFFFSGGS